MVYVLAALVVVYANGLRSYQHLRLQTLGCQFGLETSLVGNLHRSVDQVHRAVGPQHYLRRLYSGPSSPSHSTTTDASTTKAQCLRYLRHW
jgi:hypothetical protein